MKKAYAAILMVAVCAGGVFAGGNAGTTACVFLRDGQGARALAMGGAFTAVGSGVESYYWNPGGMAFGAKAGVGASYNTLIEGVKTQSVAFVYPKELGGVRQAFGVSALMLGIDGIERRDAAGVRLSGESDAGGSAYSAGYGAVLGELVGVGVQVKSVREELGSDTGDAVAFDCGVVVRMPEYSAGVSAQNYGTKFEVAGVEDDLSSVIRAGGAYHPGDSFDGRLRGLTVAADIELPKGIDAKLRLGGEYVVSRMLALRAGYEQLRDIGSRAGWSAGVGFWTDFRKDEDRDAGRDERARDEADSELILEIDYAYLMRDMFDNLHRFTITFKF